MRNLNDEELALVHGGGGGGCDEKEKGNNGWGNGGDDPAPGNSLSNTGNSQYESKFLDEER